MGNTVEMAGGDMHITKNGCLSCLFFIFQSLNIFSTSKFVKQVFFEVYELKLF